MLTAEALIAEAPGLQSEAAFPNVSGGKGSRPRGWPQLLEESLLARADGVWLGGVTGRAATY